ncbi:unnamed protein product, partial [Owenia fusiformis]
FVRENVNSDLWHFLEDSVFKQEASSRQTLQLFGILSAMLFCHNSNCKFPLPMILADVISKHTNDSTLCHTIFNTFGIIPSKTTFLRYRNDIAEKIQNQGPNLRQDSFFYISVDNVGKDTKYSRIKADNTSRRVEKTSTQLVHIKPLSNKLSHEEKTTFSQTALVTKTGLFLKSFDVRQDYLMLYRAITSILFFDLIHCERSVLGNPSVIYFSGLETKFAKLLYDKVQSTMSNNTSYFEKIDPNVPFFKEIVAVVFLTGFPIGIFSQLKSGNFEQ